MLLRNWYHGSPFGGLTTFDIVKPPVFFTPEYRVAEEYALGNALGAAQKRPDAFVPNVPTIYQVHLDLNPFDFNDPIHVQVYRDLRKNLSDEDREDFPSVTSMGFLSGRTGYPSFGYVRAIMNVLPEKFDSMFVDEGSQGYSVSVFKLKGRIDIVNVVTLEKL